MFRKVELIINIGDTDTRALLAFCFTKLRITVTVSDFNGYAYYEGL